MSLSESQIEIIIDSYKTYGGIAARAAQELSHSSATIQACWEAHGFTVKRRAHVRKDGKYTSALTDAEVKRICEAYEKYNGNASLAARHLPWSNPTIRKYWIKQGLSVHELSGKRASIETSIEQRIK